MTSNADATELPAGLLDMIEQDEGRRDTVYIDSEGHQTIGLGFCLDKMPMPREVADYWCNLILTQRHKQILIATHFGTVFKNLNQPRQCAILNMSYQLGISGLFKFKKMWDALAVGDYQKASLEAMDSVWASQTKNRAGRIAEVIRTGTMRPYQ